jgi:hypothetical protein
MQCLLAPDQADLELDEATDALALKLLTTTTLTRLRFFECSSEETEKAVLGALGRNSTLTHLHAANLHLGGNSVALRTLVAALSHNSTRTHLAVPRSGVDAEGVAQLLASTALKSLGLDANGLGTACTPALVAGLQSNSRLASLSLSNNELDSEAAAALAHALGHNSSLTSLDLGFNPVAVGSCALAAALPTNAALAVLWLANTDMSDAEAHTFAPCWSVTGPRCCDPSTSPTIARSPLRPLSPSSWRCDRTRHSRSSCWNPPALPLAVRLPCTSPLLLVCAFLLSSCSSCCFFLALLLTPFEEARLFGTVLEWNSTLESLSLRSVACGL